MVNLCRLKIAWRRGLFDKANQLYLQNHNHPLFVQILFKPRTKMSRNDVDRIAGMVVHLVKETPIEPGSFKTLERSRENSGCFPKEIVMIYIYAQLNGKENKWHCSSNGFIPQITPEQLQEKIERKDRKLNNYKFNCSERWLLFVADDLRIPSTVDLTVSAFTYQYNTRFDRVFFFWNSSRRYIELQVINTIQTT